MCLSYCDTGGKLSMFIPGSSPDATWTSVMLSHLTCRDQGTDFKATIFLATFLYQSYIIIDTTPLTSHPTDPTGSTASQDADSFGPSSELQGKPFCHLSFVVAMFLWISQNLFFGFAGLVSAATIWSIWGQDMFPKEEDPKGEPETWTEEQMKRWLNNVC